MISQPLPDTEWKETIWNELIICGILNFPRHFDPNVALQDAINWNVSVALDPRVSEDAIKLIEAHGGTYKVPEQMEMPL